MGYGKTPACVPFCPSARKTAQDKKNRRQPSKFSAAFPHFCRHHGKKKLQRAKQFALLQTDSDETGSHVEIVLKWQLPSV